MERWKGETMPASKKLAANTNKPRRKRNSGQLLYQQVDNIIRQRLIDNVWKPGEALPSEMQLAAELDVSQGTVRKALNDMVSENLLFRRQGSGPLSLSIPSAVPYSSIFHLSVMMALASCPRVKSWSAKRRTQRQRKLKS